jgi:hypothetical protein
MESLSAGGTQGLVDGRFSDELLARTKNDRETENHR